MEQAKVALGANVDLAKNHFVRLLNRKSPGLGPVIPPNKEIDRLRKEGRQRVERAYVRAKAHSKELGGDKELQQKIGKLEQRLREATRNLGKAYPIEVEALETVCQRLKDELIKLKRSAEAIHQAKSTGADTLRGEFNQLLANFPGAQILDLSKLSCIKNEKGLPAVSLFSLDKPSTAVYVGPAESSCFILTYGGHNSSTYSIVNANLHPELMRNLHVQIKKATGVGCAGSSLSATQIELTTDFPAGRIIPEKAREIIQEARRSHKFEWVGLLAAVKEWSVDYCDLTGTGKPKIIGSTYNAPETDHALIVASAMIGKRQYWFVLGAFDTTPIEDFLRAE